jgi:hypothetical protein
MSNEKFKPQLDPSAYLKVGNTGLKNWQAVNEIIANSIDSWISGGKKEDLIVRIDLNNKQNNLSKSSIRIVDNALGMEEEDLKNLFSFFKSDKANSDFSEEYLGLYGFGFKAATSKLGTKVSVITSKSSDYFYKITVDYEELIKNDENFELEIKKNKHDATTKKLFNGKSRGTLIEISSFNQTFPPQVLYDWLPISWKKFMTGEMYDKKLKLYIGDNISNSNLLQPYNLNLDEQTKVDLSIPFEWVDSEKVKQKGKVIGFFGFRTKKGPNYGMPTQGLNVYRRGQLIERHNKSYFMDGSTQGHNSRNSLVGEINIEINVNTVKNAVEDTDAHEAMSTAINKEFKQYAKSIQNMTIAVNTEDKEFIAKEIAIFRNNHGMKLNKTQENLLEAKGSISEDIPQTTSKKEGGHTVKPKKASTDVNFKLIQWNKYKIDKQEYLIEFTPYSDESSTPYTLVPVSENILNVYVYTKHPNGIEIEKALKNREKNTQSKLICSFIVSEAIEKHLKILQYSKKDIQTIKEIILGA